MPAPPLPPQAKPAVDPVLQFDGDDELDARPLTIPEFTNIKPANPAIYLRFVNCAIATKEGQVSTLRFNQMVAAGFVVATINDVHPLDRPKIAGYVQDGGSKIINGDLILMKHSRKRINAAFRDNENKAQRLGSRAETVQRGKRYVSAEVSMKNPTSENAGKISVFSPSQEDIDNLLGKEGKEK